MKRVEKIYEKKERNLTMLKKKQCESGKQNHIGKLKISLFTTHCYRTDPPRILHGSNKPTFGDCPENFYWTRMYHATRTLDPN